MKESPGRASRGLWCLNQLNDGYGPPATAALSKAAPERRALSLTSWT